MGHRSWCLHWCGEVAAPKISGAAVNSVFDGQVDDIVREPQNDLGGRKIRELDVLFEEQIVVAVLDAERGGAVGPDLKFPDLKGLAPEFLEMPLHEGDFIEGQ